jgi:hypothetical protein
MPSSPGTILPGGIVLMDEPQSAGVTTLAAAGETLLTFNARPGGNCGQIIIGLSPLQTLQLINMLQQHADYCRAAVQRLKGGAGFEPTPDE